MIRPSANPAPPHASVNVAEPVPRDLTRVAVVVTADTNDDLSTTLDSLARQEGVRVRVVVTGAAPAAHDAPGIIDLRGADSSGMHRTLRDHLQESGAQFVSFVRAGDVLLRNGLRAGCDALQAAPGQVMAHPLWLPRRSDGSIPRTDARHHLERLRRAAEANQRRLVSSIDGIPALATFHAEWLTSQPELNAKPIDRAVARLIRRLIAEDRVATVMTVACASKASPSLARVRTPRVLLTSILSRWAPRLKRPIARAIRHLRKVGLQGTAWDTLAAFLRRPSFAGLASHSGHRDRSAGQIVAYYQPRYPALSETFIRRELKALRESGVQVNVFALESGDATMVDADASAGVTYFGPETPAEGRKFIMAALRRRPWRVVALGLWIVRLGRGSWWRRDLRQFYLAGQLASAMKRARVTHVHAPWADRHSVVSFVASRLIGVTFSVQARASEIHRTRSARGLADRVRFAEFVITNSAYNERYLRGILGDAAPPLHVIYNGIDLEQFPEFDARDGSTGASRLVAVGRLVEPKGFRHLLRACRLLLDRGHDFTCEIIGSPMDPWDTITWLELRTLHAQLGLGTRLVFRGAQPFASVMDALRRAELFVLPCVRGRDGSHDITPNSLIEAMAMRLPVVSTTSGAIPEIVDNGVNGILVAPGDELALTDALERLMQDGTLRQRLGAAARRKVEERFDARRNVRRRLELLESLRMQPR